MGNERTGVRPHLSWAGPGPENPIEAYALAILVRLMGTGLTQKNARTPDMPPSSLLAKHIQLVAMMYAYCKKRIREEEIRTNEGLLLMIKDSQVVNMRQWVEEHDAEVTVAENELLEYVDTAANPGFRCYG